MKNFTFLLLCTCLLIGSALAQDPCDPKGIRTNPANALNPEKPSATNAFDWMYPAYWYNFTPPAIGGTTYDIQSPWETTSPTINYEPLALGANSDYYPEDGWELLKANFGRLADDQTARNHATQIPYLILYNKYTGTLRLFAAFAPASDYQVIKVRISHPQVYNTNNPLQNYSTSALFNAYNPVQQALDVPTKISEIEATTAYTQDKQLMFWVDIQASYDPCVCEYVSKLLVEFVGVRRGSLQLKGTETGQAKPIIQATDPTSTVAKSIFTAIGGVLQGTLTGSYNWTAITGILDIFSLANMNAEQKKILNFAKNAAAFGFQLWEAEGKLADIAVTKAQAATTGVLSPSQEATIREAAGKAAKDSLEAFKNILKGYTDFLSASFKNPASTGGTGFTTTSVVALEGTLTEEIPYLGGTIEIGTPGSKWSNTYPEEKDNNQLDPLQRKKPEYPTYNEILGTFALLKSPSLKIHQSIGAIDTIAYDCYLDPVGEASEHQKYTFKLNEIDYTFNPLLNLNYNNTKIDCKIVFKSDIIYPGDPNCSPAPRLDTCMGFGAHRVSALKSFFPQYKLSQIESSFVPINCIDDLIGSIDVNMVYFYDPYEVNGNYYDPPLGKKPDFKVFLKIAIEGESYDIGRDGQPNKFFQVFTFPVNLEYVTTSLDPQGQALDYSLIPERREITTSPVVTTNTVLSAWKDIYINADLTPAPGSTLTIRAGEAINVAPSVNIHPDVLLEIAPPVGCSANPPKDHAFVKSFCKGQIPGLSYHANEFTANRNGDAGSLMPAVPRYSLTAQPNPFSETLTLRFGPETGTLTVYDVLGRAISSNAVATDQQQLGLSTAEWQPGVYIAVYETAAGRQAVRVVRQ